VPLRDEPAQANRANLETRSLGRWRRRVGRTGSGLLRIKVLRFVLENQTPLSKSGLPYKKLQNPYGVNQKNIENHLTSNHSFGIIHPSTVPLDICLELGRRGGIFSPEALWCVFSKFLLHY
jgi:hypothetical protein